jgi:hypothetical protein
MLTEKLEHHINVLPDGQLEVKEVTLIKRDGTLISRSNHRRVIDVGEDVSAEVELIKDTASGVHTPDRISARAAIKVVSEAR